MARCGYFGLTVHSFSLRDRNSRNKSPAATRFPRVRKVKGQQLLGGRASDELRHNPCSFKARQTEVRDLSFNWRKWRKTGSDFDVVQGSVCLPNKCPGQHHSPAIPVDGGRVGDGGGGGGRGGEESAGKPLCSCSAGNKPG